MSPNYTPRLTKNVPPPLILLVASTRYGLSCPFPQTFGGNLVNGKTISPSNKKIAHFPHQKQRSKIRPSKISTLPLSPPFNTLWKTHFQLLLVFLFTLFLFHFKLYKFLLTPLQLTLHSLRTNQI